MEAFSLLKYWRATAAAATTTNLRTSSTTTISTAVSHSTEKTSSSSSSDDDEEEENGPFFDLEFSVPDEEKTTDGVDEEREDEDEESDGAEGEEDEREEGEGEFKFALEPSDELFFNGNLVPVLEPPSTAVDEGSGETPKTQFSLMKSASKFGVLMLKLKKSKQGNANANAGERTEDSVCLGKQSEKEAEAETQKQKPSQSKLFTVKFKVEEVPIMSMFTRDNSSRASSITTTTTTTKSQKKESSAADESCPDEKRASKDGVQKYLKMVKPLYIRVAKRQGNEKQAARFSRRLVAQSPVPPDAQKTEKTEKTEAGEEKGGNKQGKLLLPAGLRVVCKHLGKSRSASSAAVAAAPPVPAARQGRRRDDSLLEQQDGIQSAILHCKRSFNLSRDLESTLFSRSVSDPSSKNPSN